jgi:cell division protein FtsW (lipid II flippase)
MMILIIAVLMLTYVGLTASFAIRYDPQFWVNDAVAVVVFAILLLVAVFVDRPQASDRDR